MKKCFSVFLLVCLLVSVLTIPAYAKETYTKYEYTVDTSDSNYVLFSQPAAKSNPHNFVVDLIKQEMMLNSEKSTLKAFRDNIIYIRQYNANYYAIFSTPSLTSPDEYYLVFFASNFPLLSVPPDFGHSGIGYSSASGVQKFAYTFRYWFDNSGVHLYNVVASYTDLSYPLTDSKLSSSYSERTHIDVDKLYLINHNIVAYNDSSATVFPKSDYNNTPTGGGGGSGGSDGSGGSGGGGGSDGSINEESQSGLASKIVNGLKDMIVGLFVPEDGYIEKWLDSLVEDFNSRTGLLTYPLSLLVSFVDRVSNMSASTSQLTIPRITLPSGDVILEQQTYNFNTLLEQPEFKQIYDIYMIIIKAGMSFGLVRLIQKKSKEFGLF